MSKLNDILVRLGISDGVHDIVTLEQAEQQIKDAIQSARPQKHTIDHNHEYDANTFNKGFNAGIAAYDSSLKAKGLL